MNRRIIFSVIVTIGFLFSVVSQNVAIAWEFERSFCVAMEYGNVRSRLVRDDDLRIR